MNVRPHLAPTLTALVLVTACAGGEDGLDGGAVPSAPSPSVSEPAPSGTPAGSSSADPGDPALALPDDVPVPVPDGGELRAVSDPAPGTLQDKYVVRLVYPAGSYGGIVTFYEGYFVAEGLDVQATSSPTRSRWTWPVEIEGATSVQQVLVTTGGTFDEGGSTLEISYLTE